MEMKNVQYILLKTITLSSIQRAFNIYKNIRKKTKKKGAINPSTVKCCSHEMNTLVVKTFSNIYNKFIAFTQKQLK